MNPEIIGGAILAAMALYAVYDWRSSNRSGTDEAPSANRVRLEAQERIREAQKRVNEANEAIERANAYEREVQKKIKQLQQKEQRLENERKALEQQNEREMKLAREKMERQAELLAENKARRKKLELEESDRIRRMAIKNALESEAKINAREEMSEKFRKLVEMVIPDSELQSIYFDGDLTEERFRVIQKAVRNSELSRRLKRAKEIGGDVETVIQLEAEEIKAEGEPEKPEEPGEEIIEMIGGEGEEPEAPASMDEIAEELDDKHLDVLEALRSGHNSSAEIADYIGVSKKTVNRRYPELKEFGLIETGTSGTAITPKGEEVLAETRQ